MVCSLAGSFILSFVRSFVLAVNRNEMKYTLKGIQVKLRLLRLHLLLLLLGLIVKCRAQHFGASVRSFVRSSVCFLLFSPIGYQLPMIAVELE